MYKDKDKQKEANRAAQARFKAKRKGITITDGITTEVIPKSHTLHPAIIATINRLTTNPDGTIDEQARTIRMANALHYEQACPGRPYTGLGIAPEDIPTNPIPVRVSKPGDADYKPRDWQVFKRQGT